ncbi:MAG: VTT domain-containing protein, partial [Pseudomonadota bacterium]|nr:VTT domain-containing protein [Pseudomonadota bacterium]
WSGFLLAAGGSLLAAAATYQVGSWMGRSFLRQGMGQRLNRISRALGEKGVISVVTLRTAPIAPFTVVNLVCGASHVSFRDYMLGTAIGMAPGIIAMTAMGGSLRSVLLDPSGTNWLVVGGAVLGWIAIGIGAQVGVSWLRRRSRRD